MTAKEKAKQLEELFYTDISERMIFEQPLDSSISKKCAIVCVEEIISAIKVFYNGPEWGLEETMGWKYWHSVKSELEKL